MCSKDTLPAANFSLPIKSSLCKARDSTIAELEEFHLSEGLLQLSLAAYPRLGTCDASCIA